ncbi:uncharacterized protein F4822DRAFT_426415 [Hypoxylon trugodes]|uniref:uncharacterized protein n=1 Tax=Hypoxylon trugodes TaxID=326681 RepID=UPI002198875D|nr:uncharacterized protein F4822DRAFT_426415 [Hypoxylon trugodes]KAI1390568.1 hypothetical protein F4822DRAFT_426415 [Hypoxylon trugodes]
MSLQTPSSSGQSRSVERTEPLKTSGRLRSACDSCHQAKIRCSGGNPCLTCLVSRGQCSYSPGNRLGRPKGSKNKRAVIKENKNKREETQEGKNNNGANSRRGSDLVRKQEPQQNQQSDPMPVDFNIEQGFDTSLLHDLGSDSSDLLLNQNLASLIDSMNGTRVHTSLEEGLNASFAQASAALVPSYHDLSFGTPDSSVCDSGYATGTVSSSADETTLPSPIGGISPGGKQGSISTNAFIFPEPSHCSCLQQQVQLVYQLGDLQSSHASNSSVDCVLHGVQLAQLPWKGLMECSRCQSKENHKDVFLLFATSICILLSSVQKLNANPRQIDVSPEAALGWNFPGASGVGVSVGSFELTGDTREEVISVVIRRSLQSITGALFYLWERVGGPRSPPISDLSNGGGGTSNTSPESPFSILSRKAAKSQQPSFRRGSMASEKFGAEDIGALLDSLQRMMQTIKQDLQVYT